MDPPVSATVVYLASPDARMDIESCDDEPAATGAVPRVGLTEAVTIAQSAVPGAALRARLQAEAGELAWQILLLTPAHCLLCVFVDAQDGHVLASAMVATEVSLSEWLRAEEDG
ncbi:MAG: PepSY domain-containing protein [Gammaproteobacteria bacterium]|nr:PepSY domain-containing protein [Gammaproteobacteria bacterium]NIU05733.1 PepSY domain-containing protein [Gammaproteobacteria bacterium]NIV52493.1 hypothetical protein [Gammaproteobacteria bacterium]NIW86461.1 hypothetical protein [Gammaproteobacteria bacterium]NIX87006.1 hypothetical protein [Gammaproteobacteria bacterium]